MLALIKRTYSNAKILVSKVFIILGNFLLKLLLKIIGERNYTRLLGYLAIGDFYIKTQIRKIELFYDAHVDKDSAYYKPILRVWKFTGKTVLFILVYLFVIETNFLWLTGEMPGVDDLQNPEFIPSFRNILCRRCFVG